MRRHRHSALAEAHLISGDGIGTRTHRLTDDDLSVLATSELAADVIGRLRAAELSKHTLLLEGLRRRAANRASAQAAEIITAATSVLAEAQARDPAVVADLLALPHLGFWAATCLSLMHGDSPAQAGSALSLPISLDLSQVATFAAVAALRTGQPFELTVPMRIGVVALPTLGTLRMDLADAAGWARINSDGRREVLTVSAGSFSVELPMNANRSTRCGPAEWLPAARLRLPLGDVVLDVVLETADPFLGAICPGSAVLSRPSLAAWHRRLQSAWRILVRHHRSTAEALAAGLTTLVPLGESVPGRPVSAASGHAWGAIALSLPPDALSGAETLVHEFRHLVLSAVEDLTPLVSGSDDQRYYAPWRDDPRPLRGLLQGSYAFFGVTGFWRRQRQVGPSADRLRGELEFARGRRDVLDAVHCVAASSNLTETGQVLAHSMLASLAAWQHEPVSAGAQFTAAQASAAHRLRWRLAHLRPDQDVVEVTAQAWLAGLPAPPGTDKPPGTPEPGRTPSPIAADSPTPTPASSPPGRRRSALPRDTSIPGEQLSMAGDQETRIDDAGAAFMHVAAAARQGYLRRVVAGDSQAWVGLLLVRHQMAGLRPGAPLPERPELMVAVYERVRTLTGTAADPESLVEWFTRQR